MGGSLAWEWGQSDDEVCWGAGVDAVTRGNKRGTVKCGDANVFCEHI